MEYIRSGVRELAERLKLSRGPLQIVLGPRQVGKTTGARYVMEHWKKGLSHYATADLTVPPTAEWVSQQWLQARALWARRHSPVLLILDEVQKVPRWSETVKREWDEDGYEKRDIRVVLLGSSALLLGEGMSESLAGRFEVHRWGHWQYTEMKGAFGWDVDTFMLYGGYPGAAQFIRDPRRYRDYVRESLIETAISRDVLMGARIDKPALLRRLFVLACEYGSQVVSYTKFLGQLQDVSNTVTLASYQDLLEKAWLVAGLPKWSGSAVRRRASSPKWLPLNTALMTGLLEEDPEALRKQPARWGRWVETAVGTHLYAEMQRNGGSLSWWREGNYEVDYVVKLDQALLAIEVKSGRPRDARSGLEAFKERWPKAKTLLVGTQGIPLDRFLGGWIKDYM